MSLGVPMIDHKGFETCDTRSRLVRDIILNLTRLNLNKIEDKDRDSVVSRWTAPSTEGDEACGSHMYTIHKHATKKESSKQPDLSQD